MRIIKEKLDKISLNEEAENKRIWDVMLPEIRKHLSGEPSVFDGDLESGDALVESAVIEPCLEEFWELSDRGAYAFEWTEQDSREFSDSIKSRWSNLMWLVNEAMKGTLNDNLTFNDESWERDYKVVRLLCGDPDMTESVGPTIDDNLPPLPY